MVDALEEEMLRDRGRRQKLLELCQEYMTQEYLANVSGGKTNQTTISNSVGQIAGRSIKQIDSGDSSVGSKEARLYQRHARNTQEDLSLDHRVNSLKKSEPHLSNKILIYPGPLT